MYALVFVEPRYVAVFFTLLWVGLFSGLRMPSVHESRRLVSIVTLAVVIAIAGPTAVSITGDFGRILKGQPHNQFQVAEDLRQMGVVPGDRVARIGGLFIGWLGAIAQGDNRRGHTSNRLARVLVRQTGSPGAGNRNVSPSGSHRHCCRTDSRERRLFAWAPSGIG